MQFVILHKKALEIIILQFIKKFIKTSISKHIKYVTYEI